jgi:hypothetical protein
MSACPHAVPCRFALALLLGLLPFAELRADSSVYWLPEAELLNSAFDTEPWGSGFLVSRQALPGQGVRFVLTLGSAGDGGKTVIGDEWQVAGTAGLAWDGGYYPNDPAGPHAQPHDNVSIAQWTRYALRVTLHGRFTEMSMRLFMNTGMTGPSAYPSNNWRNNAAWLSPVTRIKGGETKVLVLDFDAAEVYSAADNPWPHSGHGESWSDGTIHAINERDRREITNIGFEAYGTGGSEVTLDINTPGSLPELDIDVGTNGAPVALSLDVDDARDYRIEWSPDLNQWHTLTNLTIVTGTRWCVDPALPRPLLRYYRAVSTTNAVDSGGVLRLHTRW